MTRQVGGDLVEVTSLATGVEDIHAVPMKPSFAVMLNHADVVLLVGLEAEHAFLPALLEASRNPKIQRDQPGYIDCSVYVTPLEVPSRIDRSLGDQHPMGNPHINLDPVLGKDDGAGDRRRARAQRPGARRRLQAKRRRLTTPSSTPRSRAGRRRPRRSRGRSSSAITPTCSISPSASAWSRSARSRSAPGVDPTPSHIAELEEQMRRSQVDLVVRELHYPAGLAETVAQQTGAKLVELPVMVGRRARSQGLHQLHRLQRADDAEGRRRAADGGAAHHAAGRRASATTAARSSST